MLEYHVNTFLYLSYTQKSFWDIYRKSSPFAETNYNPSLGISKYFFYKRKLIGVSVAIEHESNGRDSIYSRSWNRMALSWAIEASKRSRLYLSFWIPFWYEGDNPDLLRRAMKEGRRVNKAPRSYRNTRDGYINPIIAPGKDANLIKWSSNHAAERGHCLDVQAHSGFRRV